MTNDSIVVTKTGTKQYVWVEVYTIELDETTHTSPGISTVDWPELDDLKAKVEAAREDSFNVVSHLMRKEHWKEVMGLRAI